jgi:hypothetical protein
MDSAVVGARQNEQSGQEDQAMATKTTHAERVRYSRFGSSTADSRYESQDLTEPGRRAFWIKFEREVDPEGILTPEERTRRADLARQAYFARLALKSAQARRKKTQRRGSLTVEQRAERGSYLGCIAGALSSAEHMRQGPGPRASQT